VTLALFSTVAFTAKAQAAPVTTFHCVYQDGAWQTVARRGYSKPTPPIITWRTTEYEFSPKERCETVSGKLATLARDHGGKLYGIRMRTGYLNSSPVICYIDNTTSPFCDRNNHLMNLPKHSRLTPRQQLNNLFGRIDTPYASGTSVQNSAPEYEVNFGDAVERLLDATENQEGDSSPGIAPIENQGEGNSSGDGSL
jgi:hypothetical protein